MKLVVFGLTVSSSWGNGHATLWRVLRVEVKQPKPRSGWIWGAFEMPGAVLAELFLLWCERDQRDEYLGTLLNAYIERGGEVRGLRAGRGYVDVGTLHGYRQALRLLDSAQDGAADALAALGGHGARPAA